MSFYFFIVGGAFAMSYVAFIVVEKPLMNIEKFIMELLVPRRGR